MQLGFHEGRRPEEQLKVWLTHVEADDVECRGVWLPEGAFGAGPVPVATTSWFDKTLNTGRELLPLRMITDVTTNPAHRRRGLVRRLMEDCLADAVARGIPLAALTVSEATIYGRWGFGVATFGEQIEVDTGPRFGAAPASADAGRVEMVDPRDSWPLVRGVLDRLHREQPRLGRRPAVLRGHLHRRLPLDGARPRRASCAPPCTSTPTSEVDGMVLFRIDGEDGKRDAKVELPARRSAPTPSSACGGSSAASTWSSSVDLRHAPTRSTRCRWALTDLNRSRPPRLGVPVGAGARRRRALAARPWTADGDVVLEVADAQGHASGRYRVATKDGSADVTRTDDPAEVPSTPRRSGRSTSAASRSAATRPLRATGAGRRGDGRPTRPGSAAASRGDG